MSVSATIGDFLKAILCADGKVKVEGCELNPHQRVAAYADRDCLLDVVRAPPWLRPHHREPYPGFDVVFVIDATRSIQFVLNALVNWGLGIVGVFGRNRRLQLRIAYVCYRDPVDRPEELSHERFGFTESVNEFRDRLRGV
jgi:hypothetical protein